MQANAGIVASAPFGPVHTLWPGTGASLQSVVPKYLVRDTDRSMISVIRLFQAYGGIMVEAHSNDHDPVHFHLEDPVGTIRGKYEWADAKPADKGVQPLSNRELKKLNRYMDRFGSQIRARLEKNYPDHAPLPKYSGY